MSDEERPISRADQITVSEVFRRLEGGGDRVCLKPSCATAAEFVLERTANDGKQFQLSACQQHTDLFHELVLSVKYGGWLEARIFRVKVSE